MASVNTKHLYQEEKPDILTFAALTVCKQQGLISCERTHTIFLKKGKKSRQKETTNSHSKKKKSGRAYFSNIVNRCDSSKISGAGSIYTSCGSGPRGEGRDSTTESKTVENTTKLN